MVPVLLIIKISQLFIFMFLGFAIAKICKMKTSDSMILSKLGLYLLMPAAVINSFDTDQSPEILKGLLLGVISAIVIHIIFLIFDRIYTTLFKAKSVDRASAIYSNAANIIIPIISFVFGGEWVVYTLSYMTVQLCFLWTQGVKTFNPDEKISIKKIVFTPCIIAIFAGILMMMFGIRLPSYIKQIVSPLADMLGIVGMIIAGVVAANIDFKAMLCEKRVYIITFIRMILLPLIIFVVFRLIYPLIPLNNAREIMLISFLACSTPVAATVMQMAQVYGKDVELAVAVNITTTLVSIITMPIFVALF